MTRIARSLGGLAVVCGLVGCGSADGVAPPAPDVCVAGAAASGGALALDVRRQVAYVSDADNRAVHRVDLLGGEVVTADVGGRPGDLAALGDCGQPGDMLECVLVTVRDQDRVLLLAFDALGQSAELASAAVPPDPVGIAVTACGEALVTSAWAAQLTSLEASTLRLRWTIGVEREPRAVVATPGGDRAFVTHLVGDAVTAVDLRSAEAVPVPRRLNVLRGAYRNRVDRALGAGTLHPGASLSYSATLSADGSRLFLPHLLLQKGVEGPPPTVPSAYGGVPLEEETTVASVAVVSVAGERALGEGPVIEDGPIDQTASIAGVGARAAVAPPSAPTRQARAVARWRSSLLVASQGTGEVVELDATAIDPAMNVRRRFPVGEGPAGLAVDEASGIAVVWNQISHDIAVIGLESGTLQRLPVAADPLEPAVSAGRRLFVTERDRRISRDGRACAGCHPEGRDDGIVWRLGLGPRQTPTLVGRVGRGPFGWQARHAVLEDNMAETISRLGGTGLPASELTQLAAYLQRGLEPARQAAPVDATLAARGRALFESDEVGCASCHVLEREGSDRALHAVGSRGRQDVLDAFRTPPLRMVGATGPYFHDGRYATLEKLLEDNLDRMGQTGHLSREDLRALAAFLRTL